MTNNDVAQAPKRIWIDAVDCCREDLTSGTYYTGQPSIASIEYTRTPSERGSSFKEFLAEQMRDPEFAAEYRKVSAEVDAELVQERARRAAEKIVTYVASSDDAEPADSGGPTNYITKIIAAEFTVS